MVDLIDAQVLRAQQDIQFLPRLNIKVHVDITFTAFNVCPHPLFVQTLNDRCVEDVDLADEACHKQVFRLFIDFARRAVLLNFAVPHHHNAI